MPMIFIYMYRDPDFYISVIMQICRLIVATGADPEIFQRGGLRRKILKEKRLLIHVSTRVHIKTR